MLHGLCRNVLDGSFRYALVKMTGTGLAAKVGISQKGLSKKLNNPVSGELQEDTSKPAQNRHSCVARYYASEVT